MQSATNLFHRRKRAGANFFFEQHRDGWVANDEQVKLVEKTTKEITNYPLGESK